MTRRWNGRPAWLLLMAAFAVLVLAESAFAQGTIRGTVRDVSGQPVEGATVTIESQTQSRTLEVKTNSRGEFLQIGLQSGPYRVVVAKGDLGAEPRTVNVRANQTQITEFIVAPNSAALTAAAAANAEKMVQELTRLFEEGVAASNARQYDVAIQKFNEAIGINPNCFDCYNNIGYIHMQRDELDQAEAAYKQSTLVKPDDAVAYNGLATVYNAQRRFDLAAEASAKATQLAGGAGGGGGDANSLYNQGVILWNAGKIAEAKDAFQSAVNADPSHAEAHYQLGMALVNEGNMAGAATAFETYLKLAPDGPNAPTAKALLSQLRP